AHRWSPPGPATAPPPAQPGAAARSAREWEPDHRESRSAPACPGSPCCPPRCGGRCPRPSSSSPGCRPARRTDAASARPQRAAVPGPAADWPARPGPIDPARPEPPPGGHLRTSPSGSASAPPRPCHRVRPGSGHHSWPPPAVRQGVSVPSAPGPVGHNIGVTAPQLPPPTRRERVRAALSRAVDDAQLARPRLALGSLGLLCVMILGGSLMPVPYVIEQPGPAIDVLGTYDDEQILVIDGAETHPTEGSLMMTTVSV